MQAAGSAITAVVVAVGLIIAGCSGGVPDDPEIDSTVRPGVAPVPPSGGAYFGIWSDDSAAPAKKQRKSGGPATPSPSGTPAEDGRAAAVARTEAELGRRLDIVPGYYDWKQKFPADDVASLARGGRYPLLTWGGGDTRQIVKGGHDDLIRDRARAIKALNQPVFLRWQDDMDRAGLTRLVHTPSDYIAAWKHIRTLFRAEGVENAAWVWCPTATGFNSGDAAEFYPGDDHVDWICADVYPSTDLDYGEIDKAAQAFLEWAEGRPKPIMIAEFGVPRAYESRRAEWLRSAARTLQHPQIKAVVYFDSDADAAGARDERRQYGLSGDDEAVSALRELATGPYFNPRGLPVSSTG